jgi:hypothetical protein
LLRDVDAHAADLLVTRQQAIAQREAEDFDLFRPMVARHAVHDVLQRFARQQAVGVSLLERRREAPLEPARDRQVTRIVPIPAPHDPHHPHTRLAMTARSNHRHG